MASFSRTRRAQGGFLRSFAVLLAISALLLLLRNSDPVRAASTVPTHSMKALAWAAWGAPLTRPIESSMTGEPLAAAPRAAG